MIAIFKRDFKSLFNNVVGALFVSILCGFFGLFFLIYNLLSGYPYLSYPISSISTVVIILTPILCMRVFTEERKNKTDQLIFTSPVSAGKIVVGKFLSVALTYTIAIAFIALSPIVLEIYGANALGQNYTSIFGFYIFGLACIAIALFVSTFTKSQIISVIASFVVLFVGYILDSLLGMIFQSENFISRVFNCLCIARPLQNFLNGIFDFKALIYYVLVIVLFLFLSYCVINKRRWTLSKQVINRIISQAAAILISVVIFIAINVSVSYIPDTYMQLDVTSNSVYTMSDEGREFMKSYDEDAVIYVLATESSCDPNLKKTLDQFDRYDSVEVIYINPGDNPMFASQYTSQSLSANSLIVVRDGNSKAINYDDIYEYNTNQATMSVDISSYDGEGLIISALESVVNNNDCLIYTLTGHDELSLGQRITSSISKGNYNMQSLNLLEADSVPSDCTILIVNAPSIDLSGDDVSKIRDYIDKGGNIILNIANVNTTARTSISIDDMPNYKNLLESYGISAKAGVVCDDSSGYYYRQSYALLPEVLTSDVSIGIEGTKQVLLYSATAMEISEDDRSTFTPILKTSDNAYIKTDLANDPNASSQRAESDESGSFILGVEKKEDNGAKIIVYGCQYLFDDAMDSYVYGHNSKLFANSISALSDLDSDEVSNIIIPSKSLSTESIMVTGAALIIYGILWGIIIPLGVLIAGIIIWAIRKKQ